MMTMRVRKELFTHSNLIEGTPEQGISGPIADNYSVLAWRTHLENRALEDVDISTILGLHQITTQRQKNLKDADRGVFRDEINKVSAGTKHHKYPHWSEVEGLIETWLDVYRDMTPIDAHIVFEKIHPLVDGNGRVGRQLLWHHQLAVGEVPMAVGKCNVDEYFELFQ